MAVKTFNTRIKLKTDTNANWTTNGSLVLLSGEFAFDSTKKNFKIGNGTSAFSALPYVIGAAVMADYTELGSGVTPTAITSSMTLNEALANLQGQVSAAVAGGVTDVKMDNASVVTNNIASLSSDASHAYNASTNKLATVGTVTAAIEDLDVSSFAQANITTSTGASTLTINGISETDGKIATDTTTNKYDVAIDGEYDASTNKIATKSTVTEAIGALDTQSDVQAVTYSTSGNTTTLTFKGVSETDGIIAQGTGTGTVAIGDGALKLSGYGETTSGETPTIPTVSAADVFSANDTADSTIALSNAFVLDTTNKTIGLRTNQAVAADNNIATMKDIASLTGAMHYKGGVTAYPTPTSSTKAGDTYVVTTEFTVGSVKYEVGDMLVANADGASATYTVVQSNMTLGVGQGQVAANSAALTNGNIVVASATGIQTSSYSVANIASQATSLSESSGTVTVSDTLTVGGTAQTAQTFTITGGNALTASLNGTAITIDHDVAPTSLTNHYAKKVGVDSYGHVELGDDLASSDISHIATIGETSVTTVSGAISALETLAEGAVQDVKTLNTTATTAQTPASAEVIEGTGSITLHKIAKTANPADLIQPSGDMIIFDCGSATTNISGESGAIAPDASTPNA